MNFIGNNQLESGLHFPCSSAALLSQETLQQPPLRKSSSAIDWNGAVVEATRKASRQFDWQTALFDNSRKNSFSTVHHHLPNQISEHQTTPLKGGLVMNALDNQQKQSNQGMSVVAAQMPAQQNHFAQQLAASASSAATTSAPTTTAPVVPEIHQERSAASGMFGGMFHRGFFSKPVERTEEENYRYLMALDR
ncbi:unnamed protein product [Caenorhabditis angaria]|uniref:Uncharacterized protein n=1 Tax=Caenorhabditis angaria TaxID=860376 RepID=A0A9P1IYP2_9PELO|nr:unnamed protein product [Caenorhabditis angaria]